MMTPHDQPEPAPEPAPGPVPEPAPAPAAFTLSRLPEDHLVSVAVFCPAADGLRWAAAARWARDVASTRISRELGADAPDALGLGHCWLRFLHACGGASAKELPLFAGRLEMKVLPHGEGNGATFTRDVAVCVHVPRDRWLSTALRFPGNVHQSLPRPGEPMRIKHPPPVALAEQLLRAEIDAGAEIGLSPRGRSMDPYCCDSWGRYRPPPIHEDPRESYGPFGPFLVCRATALGDAADARKLAEISGYLLSTRGFAVILEGYEDRVGPTNRMFFVPRKMMRFDDRPDRTVLIIDNNFPEREEADEDELWALLPVLEQTSGRNTHADWWKTADETLPVDEICEHLSVIVSEIEHAPRGLDGDFLHRIRVDGPWASAAYAGRQMQVKTTRLHHLVR